jgi:hypothetical protein
MTHARGGPSRFHGLSTQDVLRRLADEFAGHAEHVEDEHERRSLVSRVLTGAGRYTEGRVRSLRRCAAILRIEAADLDLGQVAAGANPHAVDEFLDEIQTEEDRGPELAHALKLEVERRLAPGMEWELPEDDD